MGRCQGRAAKGFEPAGEGAIEEGRRLSPCVGWLPSVSPAASDKNDHAEQQVTCCEQNWLTLETCGAWGTVVGWWMLRAVLNYGGCFVEEGGAGLAFGAEISVEVLA